MEVLGGLFFVVLGSYFAYALGLQPLKQLLTYRSCQIRSAKFNEQVYLKGIVGKTPQLNSPLSLLPCVKWRILVTETRGSSKHKTTFTVLEIGSEQPYTVCDRTSKLLVSLPDSPKPTNLVFGRLSIGLPQLALSDLIGQGKPSYFDYQNMFQAFKNERSVSFLADHRIPLKGVMGLTRNLSINEYILQPGRPIHLWGQVIRHHQERCLVPNIVSQRSRQEMIWVSLGLGIFGSLFVLIGLKLVYEFGLR